MKRRLLFGPKKTISLFKHILLVLLDGALLENEIFRRLVQTGLPGLAYKGKIMAAIKFLEKGGFIIDVSGLKRHGSGKWQPKELTPIGRELAELMNSIDQYYVSFSELTNTITQNFRVPYIDEAAIQHFEGVEMDQQHNTVLRNILRNKGLSDEAIDRCGELYIKTGLVRQTFSPESVFSMVIMRYIYVISKSNLENRVNETIKKDILNEIITNAISEHLSYILKEMDKHKHLHIRRTLSHFTMDTVLNGVIRQAFDRTIRTISHDNLINENILNDMIIEKEITDTFASIMSILKPSVEFIDGEIKNLENFLKREKIAMNEAEVKQNRKLQTLLERYKKMKRK